MGFSVLLQLQRSHDCRWQFVVSLLLHAHFFKTSVVTAVLLITLRNRYRMPLSRAEAGLYICLQITYKSFSGHMYLLCYIHISICKARVYVFMHENYISVCTCKKHNFACQSAVTGISPLSCSSGRSSFQRLESLSCSSGRSSFQRLLWVPLALSQVSWSPTHKDFRYVW